MLSELTAEEQQDLIKDIATRAGTTGEIAGWYTLTRAELVAFVDAHRPQLERAKQRAEEPPEASVEPLPADLDALWITNKTERLKRYQVLADLLYTEIQNGKYEGAELAMAIREYRSYCTTVANELGQLLHRGAGDTGTGDSLSIEIEGVNMDSMR